MASDGALSGAVVTTRGSGSHTSVSSGFMLVFCARAGSVSSTAAPAMIIDLLFIFLFDCNLKQIICRGAIMFRYRDLGWRVAGSIPLEAGDRFAVAMSANGTLISTSSAHSAVYDRHRLRTG